MNKNKHVDFIIRFVSFKMMHISSNEVGYSRENVWFWRDSRSLTFDSNQNWQDLFQTLNTDNVMFSIIFKKDEELQQRLIKQKCKWCLVYANNDSTHLHNKIHRWQKYYLTEDWDKSREYFICKLTFANNNLNEQIHCHFDNILDICIYLYCLQSQFNAVHLNISK